MNKILHSILGAGLLCAAQTASAQSCLFDFNDGPQYTGTPLFQTVGGITARFAGQGDSPLHPGYSIQNISQVILMNPTGFSGLGICPSSVYRTDLLISFMHTADGSPAFASDFDMLVAPQELDCDSSSKMRITAYNGATQVGTSVQIAPELDFYMWPTIDLSFSSPQLFDRVVIHFEAGPPTGGDWGPIFVADNMTIVLPALFGDLNGDGMVDGGDVGLMLLDYGPCPGCPTDLDGDGYVDGADMGLLLLNFS